MHIVTTIPYANEKIYKVDLTYKYAIVKVLLSYIFNMIITKYTGKRGRKGDGGGGIRGEAVSTFLSA